MLSIEETIEIYVAAWNEKGLAEYKTAFARCWAPDAIYTDPNFALVKGLDGIAELADKSLDLFPTRTFYVLTTPDYHHKVGRYTWKVVLPEETREGFDYFEFNDENMITRIVSFFGPLKPVE